MRTLMPLKDHRPAGRRYRRSAIALRNVILVLGAVALASESALADTSLGTAWTYQGLLKQDGLATNGYHDLSFNLWRHATSTAALDQVGPAVCVDNVVIVDGLFTVQLDFGAAALDGNARWLEVAVRADATSGNCGVGGYTTLTPRQSLTAIPYALQTRGIFVDQAGRVGIGTTVPEQDLHVAGDMRVADRTAFGNDAYIGMGGGVWPEFERTHDFSHVITDFSSTQYWSPILSTVSLLPNEDLDDPNWKEIYGNSFETHVSPACSNDLGLVVGLYGGASQRGSGNVVDNIGSLIAGVVEGPGTITWNEGIAVAAGCGHHSTGHVENNIGIIVGTGNWGDGGTVDLDYGLYMQRPFTTHPINTHYGIYLEDQRAATGTNYSIYSDGGDVYLDGNVEVTGTLAKGGGSFKIDHPLDPQNKYLYHSFVESPDMMNIYNGNVTTDESGYAVVELPAWFEALNRDFRYQLTVLDESGGDDFVAAKVARKVASNRFTIRTSAPRVEVSWQVTGIRHDKWADANRIPVDQDKPADKRGTYLHPEAYGQPANPATIVAPRSEHAARMLPGPTAAAESRARVAPKGQ